MTDINFMYLSTCKALISSLKDKVTGFVRTDFNIEAKCCVVDIRYKGIEYRQIVSNFDKYVYEGGVDNLAIIIAGSYKNYVDDITMKGSRAKNITPNEVYR